MVSGQTLLVAAHDFGGDALVVILGNRFGLRGIQAHVFPQTDRPLPLACGCSVGASAAVFQDAGHVVAVQDAEGRFEAQRLAILAQHPHAQRVKGANQHLFCATPNQALGPLAHFGSGLVGKGDGRNALGLQPRLNQPPNLVRNHPRLARARARQHEAGAVQVVHSFLLGQVQAGGGGGHKGRGERRESYPAQAMHIRCHDSKYAGTTGVDG